MAGLAVGSLVVPLLVTAGGPVAAVLGAAAPLPVVALVRGRALVDLDTAADVPIGEIALLRSLRIFRFLPGPELEGLARSARRLGLRPGEVLIREGDAGDRFYAVVDGGLDVTVHGGPAGRMVRATGSARSPCSEACRARPRCELPGPALCLRSTGTTSSLPWQATRPPDGRRPPSPMSGSRLTVAVGSSRRAETRMQHRREWITAREPAPGVPSRR
jgi:hypothetical protein